MAIEFKIEFKNGRYATIWFHENGTTEVTYSDTKPTGIELDTHYFVGDYACDYKKNN